MSAHVTVSGPIFDGRDAALVSQMCDAIGQEVASRGEDMVLVRLDGVLRHKTGHYESTIAVSGVGGHDYDVIGDNCIYGPWLEGVGSRNSPVTRFPGYFTFRQTTQLLDRAAGPIADEVAAPFVARM